jgi:signal peptidase I
MSINEEFTNSNKEEVKEKAEKTKKSTKLTKKSKIYFSIFGVLLAALVVIGSVMVYQALTYVVGCFDDYSMAPTINKVIKDEKGREYSYSNYRNRNGNVVEYGLIEPVKTKPTFKRFEVVVKRIYEDEYFFNPFRVVGLPGETIKLDYYGQLFVNGEKVNQPIDSSFLELDWSTYGSQPIEQLYFEETLGEGEYYLLKDNRYYYKNDSRSYGPYKYEDIYGTVIAIQGTCTIMGSSFINCSYLFLDIFNYERYTL